MITGRYVLYLTCDCRDCAELKALATEIGVGSLVKPKLEVFESTSRTAAHEKAIEAGWQISKDRERATAPGHTRARRKKS